MSEILKYADLIHSFVLTLLSYLIVPIIAGIFTFRYFVLNHKDKKHTFMYWFAIWLVINVITIEIKCKTENINKKLDEIHKLIEK